MLEEDLAFGHKIDIGAKRSDKEFVDVSEVVVAEPATEFPGYREETDTVDYIMVDEPEADQIADVFGSSLELVDLGRPFVENIVEKHLFVLCNM
jgi:hypothetical protein